MRRTGPPPTGSNRCRPPKDARPQGRLWSLDALLARASAQSFGRLRSARLACAFAREPMASVLERLFAPATTFGTPSLDQGPKADSQPAARPPGIELELPCHGCCRAQAPPAFLNA